MSGEGGGDDQKGFFFFFCQFNNMGKWDGLISCRYETLKMGEELKGWKGGINTHIHSTEPQHQKMII